MQKIKMSQVCPRYAQDIYQTCPRCPPCFSPLALTVWARECFNDVGAISLLRKLVSKQKDCA